VILLLGIYSQEHKSRYNRDTCTSMFIAALFTIAKLWEQPRCPTTDEWEASSKRRFLNGGNSFSRQTRKREGHSKQR
jgi:hypothetical protein